MHHLVLNNLLFPAASSLYTKVTVAGCSFIFIIYKNRINLLKELFETEIYVPNCPIILWM